MGFTPHIEKRLDITGMHYTVVLGPLDDDHQRTLKKLKENNLSYFYTE